MNQNKEKLRNDIHRAESVLLFYSWIGAISALLIIGYGAWRLM
jgi:hypothetical protein